MCPTSFATYLSMNSVWKILWSYCITNFNTNILSDPKQKKFLYQNPVKILKVALCMNGFCIAIWLNHLEHSTCYGSTLLSMDRSNTQN